MIGCKKSVLVLVMVTLLFQSICGFASDRLTQKCTVPFDVYGKYLVFWADSDFGRLHLMLDTGSPATVLSSRVLRRFRPLSHESRSPGKFDVGKLKHLRIGGVSLGELEYLVNDEYFNGLKEAHPEVTIDGLLGLNALGLMATGVDLLSNRITFWKSAASLNDSVIRDYLCVDKSNSNTTAAGKMYTVPLIVSNEHLYMDVKLGAATARMIFDTGSPVSIAGPRLSPYVRSVTQGLPTETNLLGKQSSASFAVANSISIGGAEFPNWLYLSLSKSDDLANIGILSYSVFDQCRFVIDIRSKHFYFRLCSNERIKEANLFRVNGLVLVRNGSEPFALAMRGTGLSQYASLAALPITRINGKGTGTLTREDFDAIHGSKRVSVVSKSADIPGKHDGDAVVYVDGSCFSKPPLEPSAALPVRLRPDVPIGLLLPAGGLFVPVGFQGDPVPSPPGASTIPIGSVGVVVCSKYTLIQGLPSKHWYSAHGVGYPSGYNKVVSISAGSIVIEPMTSDGLVASDEAAVYPPPPVAEPHARQ